MSRWKEDVKIAGLWKRSQNISMFTKPNYKHRVFILTSSSLSYYCGTTDRVGQLKGRVDIHCVKAVEYVDQSAFGIPHMLQIFHFNRKHGFIPLYVIARDEVECNDWIAELRKVCHMNKDMLLYYHPGAHRAGTWTCCRRRDRSTMGCHPTHALLTRGQSNYTDIRRRVSVSDSGIISPEVEDQKKKGLPKSKSAAVVSQASVHKQKQQSAEGGTTRSTSFVDMTSIAYSGRKKGSAAMLSTKHSGSGGEISDSCITLPVERMEGVKEEEEGTTPHYCAWPHSRSTADLMSNMVVYSPRLMHGHQPQHSKLSTCSYASTESSPLHLHVNTSWSHLSASSGGSQPSSLKKTSCPSHITSSGPVREEDVNHLSARRREMDLMTHNVSSLSQPDTPPSPQCVRASDMYYSTGEERSCSVPLLDFSPKRMKPTVPHRPNTHQRPGGKRGKEAGPAAVKASPPMITPRISDAQPFIIHL